MSPSTKKKILISFSGYDDETFDFILRYNPKLTPAEHIPLIAAYLSAALEQFSNILAEHYQGKNKEQIGQDIVNLIQEDLNQA